MALEEETQTIVSQFEFSDADVNKAVKEFLRQMGMCSGRPFVSYLSPVVTDRLRRRRFEQGWN